MRAVTGPSKGANKDYLPSRRPYDFPISIGSILMEWKKTSIDREWETGDQHALQRLAPFQWNGKNLLSCELENVLQRFLRVAERIPWLVNSAVMAHPNCRGPGQGPVLGTMGFCIMLCTVHTTQGQRTIVIVCKRSLGQGNVFTPVCDSVHGRGGLPRGGGSA